MKLLISLLVLAAGLGSASTSLRAQTVAPDPTPTIIMIAPYIINTPGYYQLGANLYYAGNGSTNDAIITINASNVTLDFAGHYISGPSNSPGSTLYGVYASEQGNLVIQNGTIAFCRTGIYLNGSGNTGSPNINQTAQNMLVSYCYAIGIEFAQASNSLMLNNRISFIGGSTNFTMATGLWDYNGSGDKADGNTVTDVTTSDGSVNAYGITSTNGTLEVSGNTISNVTNTGSGAGVSMGVYRTAFTVNNLISDCYYGVFLGGDYMGNLTSNCTAAFSGGTSVGVNN